MKAAALRGALSDRARAGRIHVVESLLDGDKPSTKDAVAALADLSGNRRQLVVLERADALTWLSLRNVASVHLLAVDQLNTYDVLLCRRRDLHQGRLRRVRQRHRRCHSAPGDHRRAPGTRRRPRPRTPRPRRPRPRTTAGRGSSRRGEAGRGHQGRRQPGRADRRRGRRGRQVSTLHKDHRDVLIAPVVSEKSYGLLDANKYTFLVRPGREQDRDQGRGREGVRRQGHLGEHDEPARARPVVPARAPASARTPSARSSASPRVTASTSSEARSPDRPTELRN